MKLMAIIGYLVMLKIDIVLILMGLSGFTD